MQKLYTTTLSCKHEFQVRVHSKSSGILPNTGLFETSVVLEEVQLAYSRRSKVSPSVVSVLVVTIKVLHCPWFMFSTLEWFLN